MTSSADAEPATLLDAARSGDRSALARLLSKVERGGAEARSVSEVTYGLVGRATTVGITGAPGAGKSTLTSSLVREMRSADVAVGVLAIDPSSPFTGGAILGDRVRMDEHVLDDEVFIRSMATRGHLGGLSVAVPDAARVLDAVGMEWVLIETVGVGQVEVEIAGEADTTIVVVNPGWGDTVQANKAGLMEIADIFVVNKSDRAGVDETVSDLERMLSLRSGSQWRPPVIRTIATEGVGSAQLWAAIQQHGEWSRASGEFERRRALRREQELRRIVNSLMVARVEELASGEAWRRASDDIAALRLDPWAAANSLLD
ncbi:MAG: methylmalonyl Co-A mutase-associated GTPase MeaB [Acidimicrobiia bacterium]|nr:methylmalonyl Co-A mutase-associated GTPase MeaB [Acidimicrobiia bacterium]